MVNPRAPFAWSGPREAPALAEARTGLSRRSARLPEDGWALLGLAESLRKQKKNAEKFSNGGEV